MNRPLQSGIVALILAGGKGSRMGGGDKPLRLLHGKPILAHTIEAINPQVDAILLNANGDGARFGMYQLPVIPDSLPDYPGPLAGILAGLEWLAQHRPDTQDLLSVPGDCPFLPADLVEQLNAARQRDTMPLACAGSGGWTHPVIGLWPLSIKDALREALGAGERKIDRFTARFGCATANWPMDLRDPFFNVNTPDDLLEAERLAEDDTSKAREDRSTC
jgi:molybdenum cofactor guanylyltransferase